MDEADDDDDGDNTEPDLLFFYSLSVVGEVTDLASTLNGGVKDSVAYDGMPSVSE